MLPQLAAFDAVMRLGSVTRASEALHMAQPTVSGHLRKLSDAVGVPLFRCDGRHMHPTAPARALHAGTMGVFAALHDLECTMEPLRNDALRRHDLESMQGQGSPCAERRELHPQWPGHDA
jgi:DNA-binding transcriptional LysR family regulator